MLSQLLLILLLLPIQEPSSVIKLEQKADQIYTDNLENLYVVQGFSITKYSSKGKELFTYSNTFLGNISSISIGEGLKVMVYYQETGQLAVLDNTLSELSPTVVLNFNGLGTATLATTSVQNSYWFYDPIQGAIIRTTNTFKEIFNSGNLDQLLGVQINPTFMIERGDRLYLNDPLQGVLVFDLFGTYLKTIPIFGINSFQVTEHGIYYLKDHQSWLYSFKNFDQTQQTIPVVKADQVLFTRGYLFIRNERKASIWKRTPHN